MHVGYNGTLLNLYLGSRISYASQQLYEYKKKVNPNTPKETKLGQSVKEAARDVFSWARGERPTLKENGEKFAMRLLNNKYGEGNWKKGPGSEFNKIKKWGDRAFK